MTVGVVVFPGSNCDHDAEHVLREVCGQEVRLVWHKDSDLGALDAVVLPGGFSYGDYLRTGGIARFSPVMRAVGEFARKGGRGRGICNGFQILQEAGLLPGAMLRNRSVKFLSQPVHCRVERDDTIATAGLAKGTVITMPIAHGEGNFYLPDEELDRLEGEGQVVFRYTTRDGRLEDAANPNGSRRAIAGVCNAGRNVVGLMPHPERAAEPELGESAGRLVFESLLRSLVSV
jgi:phosphoribosylformylglycinamidine synthase I